MSFEQVNSATRETGAFPPATAVRIPNDALDMETLNAFEELQSDDGSDLIIELIDLYLQDAPQQIVAIGKASAAAGWAQLRRAAHNLKGSSSTLGVRHVAEICEKLEVRTYGPDPSEGVEALVQLLEYKFAKARQALAAERHRRLV
jgi:HPt (histidine-containing phosphotransfer) domain-containing protein